TDLPDLLICRFADLLIYEGKGAASQRDLVWERPLFTCRIACRADPRFSHPFRFFDFRDFAT
ncbi:MAG: hypothetical protein IIY82_04245, partial [Firmicutes bacterium]|nr:hypothetical protein [Bacillota bacterium]